MKLTHERLFSRQLRLGGRIYTPTLANLGSNIVELKDSLDWLHRRKVSLYLAEVSNIGTVEAPSWHHLAYKNNLNLAIVINMMTEMNQQNEVIDQLEEGRKRRPPYKKKVFHDGDTVPGNPPAPFDVPFPQVPPIE